MTGRMTPAALIGATIAMEPTDKPRYRQNIAVRPAMPPTTANIKTGSYAATKFL
jgi:hypothetical protein